MGMRMPGWYDVPSFSDLNQRYSDETGIMRSQQYVYSLIESETTTKNIPSSRIVIGGFSQGGAISLFSGVTCPVKLAGIFGLSSYLLLHGKIRDLIPKDTNPNQDTPVFMGHGDEDPLVRYDWGVMTAEKLRDWGYNVDFRTYE